MRRMCKGEVGVGVMLGMQMHLRLRPLKLKLMELLTLCVSAEDALNVREKALVTHRGLHAVEGEARWDTVFHRVWLGTVEAVHAYTEHGGWGHSAVVAWRGDDRCVHLTGGVHRDPATSGI